LVDQDTHKQGKILILKGIYITYIAASKVLDTEKMLFFHVLCIYIIFKKKNIQE